MNRTCSKFPTLTCSSSPWFSRLNGLHIKPGKFAALNHSTWFCKLCSEAWDWLGSYEWEELGLKSGQESNRIFDSRWERRKTHNNIVLRSLDCANAELTISGIWDSSVFPKCFNSPFWLAPDHKASGLHWQARQLLQKPSIKGHATPTFLTQCFGSQWVKPQM